MSSRRQAAHISAKVPRLILFLDIDGILHSSVVSDELEGLVPIAQDERRVAFVRGQLNPGAFGMLVPEKQALLATILRRYPQVVIVISSAWRCWRGYRWTIDEVPDLVWERDHVESLNWLKSLLHPVLAERIIGKTGLIHDELTGSLNWRATRLDEIRAYMRDHAQALGLADNWVAIDDQARHFTDLNGGVFQDAQGIQAHAGAFPVEAVLLVDGVTALTEASAAALDAALQHATACLCSVEVA